MLFLLPDVEPEELDEPLGGWFLDWLQEMRFEAKQTNLLSSLRFATLGIQLDKEKPNGKACVLTIHLFMLFSCATCSSSDCTHWTPSRSSRPGSS